MEHQNEIEQQVEHVEVFPLGATEAIERAAIDVQIATAHRYPRSLAVFMARAKDMVSVDKSTAESCMYSRPVGKKDGRTIYASGESIRLAEIVAACYGNLRYGGMITEMTERYVKAQGAAHDLETNAAVTAEVIESTVDRNGRPYSERQRVIMAKAAQSKAIRDAIFRVVPKSLCRPVVEVAQEVALGEGVSMADRRGGLARWIVSLDIDPERVWLSLGVEGLDDITNKHLILLTGVKTAIKDGDVAISEAFPPVGVEESATGVAALKAKITGSPEPPAEPKTPMSAKERKAKVKASAVKKKAAKAAKAAEPQDVPDTAPDTPADGPEPEAGADTPPEAETATEQPVADPPESYRCQNCDWEGPGLAGNRLCPKCLSKNVKLID